MPRCPTCETDFSETLAACPACAEATADPVRCPRCEVEYEGGDACPACGAVSATIACELHADRDARERCVLCGRALCTGCGTSDRGVGLCEEHRTVPIIEQWAQVYSTTSEWEAKLLRENLKAEGLDAQVFSQKDMMFNVDLGELSIVRLLVPVWEHQQAMRVIHERMDVEGEVAFACYACGEPFEAGARECGACGASLV